MNISTKKIIEIIKRYSFKSVFFMYWKKFFLILLIPFVCLNGAVYFTYSHMINERMLNSAQGSAAVAGDILLNQFDVADRCFMQLSENTLVKNYLTSPSQTDNTQISQIINEMQRFITNSSDVQSIYIYNFLNDYVLSSINGTYRKDFYSLDWYYHYLSTKKTNFAISSYAPESKSASEKVFQICYGVYYKNSLYGMIIVNFNYDALSNAFSKGDTISLTDRSGYVIYSNNVTLLGKKLSRYYTYDLPSGTDAVCHREMDYISTAVAFPARNVSLVSVTDLDVSGKGVYVIILLVGTVLFTVLLPILISLYISFSFYKTISKILSGFSSLEGDDGSEKHIDEISFITDTIVSLSDKNKNIENELSNKMAQLKKTQLAAMQLQFNQHFLFNTLNLISMTARVDAKGKNPTSTAISLLSDLLRISLDTNQYIVPVSSEIMYSKKFIEIEQLKVKNDFSVIWDIDSAVYDYCIIKLLFQPIIENALKYALRPTSENKQAVLKITGREEGETIVFHFKDNGPGFDKNELESFNRALSEGVFLNQSHIGLSNVNSRIKLVFGDSYGVKITSSPSGTDIRVTIGKIKAPAE